MLKTLLLLLILFNFSSSRSLEEICKNEMSRFIECSQKSFKETMDTYKKELEFSTVSPVPKLERLRVYIACYGEVTCDGLPKQVKYHLESNLFTVEQLDLASGCIDENDLRRDMDRCIYFKFDGKPDDIFACAENLAKEGECDAKETIAIMTAALVQKDFGKEMEQVMEGKKQFDASFDPVKYQY